ncbi:hypothetical protein BT96DRAFT_1022286 [Gymnopus androsaceus JB14]|uniref:Aminoglycoside phosphotransferase domain-containing protein n=1 Tax=Gymnopus androsaceus JB14 TaxID=1447944 RepID=A0A6A4HB90_9AGAR|nr:hypothetical protein BT96DRAFT_1022286 [Gymnopus androsaceus JB14]
MALYLKIAAYHTSSSLCVPIEIPSSSIRAHDLFKLVLEYQWPPRLSRFAVPNQPFEEEEDWQEYAHRKTLQEGGLEKWCQIYSEEDLIDFSSQVSKGIKAINAFGIYRDSEYRTIKVALKYKKLNQVIKIRVHPCFNPDDLDWALQLSHKGFRTTREIPPAFSIPTDILPSSLRSTGLVHALQSHPGKAWTEGALETACGCLTTKEVIHVIASSITFTLPTSPPSIRELQKRFLALSLSAVTPSTGGTVEKFSTRQSQTDYFECGRPANKSPVYPPSLYSDICARAIDARHEEPSALDERLFIALDPVMRDIYEHEDQRKLGVREVLNNEGIGFKQSSIQESLPSSTGRSRIHTFTTDKDLCVKVGVAGGSFYARYLYDEEKNDTGTGGAVAFFEGLLYYCAGSKVVSDQQVNSHLPAVLMTAVGNTLSIHFCVFVERPISQLLAEHTFGYDESDGFSAIASPSFINPPKDYQPHFPYPRSCKSISPSGGVTTFKYDGHLDTDVNHQYRLFKVTLGDGRRAIIKFTQRYGLDAHQAAEKLGLAPELIGYEELPAGWKMPQKLQILCGRCWKERLAKLHVEGFVHGDLRAQNVLVSDGDIKVIDWDFAGRDGDVDYPRDLNRGRDLWRPNEVKSLVPIKREHDQAMIEYLLSILCRVNAENRMRLM